MACKHVRPDPQAPGTEASIAMTVSNHTMETSTQAFPFRRLLWRSYLRTSLIPLFVIEVGFLATYWVSETLVYRKNTEAVSELSRQYFNDIARREATTISASLEAIASHTRVFAYEARTALDGSYMPPPAERARYKLLPSGGLYTTFDNGTTASFYSGSTQVGRAELEKVWRLGALDPFMIAVKQSNPQIAALYFNTFDSYNRIYPYVDASSQYSPNVEIPTFNFYYEADAEHNPERRDVWTDAYVDPAGNGWMVSSIAPVWRGDKLEGVVGIDVTLETIIRTLLDLELPWSGYAMLVDQNGGIIAMPPAGERDFGLDELTDHDYSQAVLSDTHKPENFNLNLRPDTQALAEAMKQNVDGEIELELEGERLASFSTVPQTGWRLVIIAPTDAIYADALALHTRLKTVGFGMLAVLLGFYLLFFAFLTQRARRMSRLIDEPLAEISELIDHISDRSIEPSFSGSSVHEMDELGHHLIATRKKLLNAEDEARTQSRIARTALIQLREANSEMFSFTQLMSHEIRTPLSIIDGSAQIIQRKADTLSPADLRDRAARLRKTVATVADMLTKLLTRFEAIVMESPVENGEMQRNLCMEVRALAEAMFGSERVRLTIPDQCPSTIGQIGTLIMTIQEVFEYVAENSPPDSPIEVALDCDADTIVTTITSEAAADDGYRLKRASSFAERLGGTIQIAPPSCAKAIKIVVPTWVSFVNGRK